MISGEEKNHIRMGIRSVRGVPTEILGWMAGKTLQKNWKSNHANQKQVYLEYFYFDPLLCYLPVKEQYHFQVLIENGDTLFLSPLIT